MTGQAVWLIYMHLASHNYSTCISNNFFIFCPICLKFSHKFLHTYSFIVSIKNQNWKISRFWVVDPLNDGIVISLRIIICTRRTCFCSVIYEHSKLEWGTKEQFFFVSFLDLSGILCRFLQSKIQFPAAYLRHLSILRTLQLHHRPEGMAAHTNILF